MAQVDTSIVIKLRKAILNICQYPRGCRRFSDIIGKCITSMPLKEGKELLKTVGDLVDEHVFNSANNYFDNEAPFELDDILISGSISEGMQKANLTTLTFSDTDFFLILKNIKVTEEEQEKGNLTMKENTPFVNLYLTDEDVIRTWADFVDISSQALSENNPKLSSMKLKERFREKYVSYGPIFMPLAKEDVEKVDEGPSVAVSTRPPGNGGAKTHSPLAQLLVEEFDFVLAIKCDGWPLCAQEWSTRPRCWPNEDIVQKIIKGGFHIVCKSSSAGDFRLSYSNAETILIQNLSNLQHKTYRALKSFVNHYKNDWSPNVKKIICSYHLKTIMLWYCEKSDPRHWTEETIVVHLLSLIDDLIKALKDRSLAMYFMPKYNLMERMEDGTEVAENISELRFNIYMITDAVISEEPNIAGWGNYLCNTVLPGCNKPFQKGIERGHFELNDFFEYFETMTNSLGEYWINSAGRIPTRNNVQAKRAVDILREPIMKYIHKIFESFNHCYLNKTLPFESKEDDENENQ